MVHCDLQERDDGKCQGYDVTDGLTLERLIGSCQVHWMISKAAVLATVWASTADVRSA